MTGQGGGGGARGGAAPARGGVGCRCALIMALSASALAARVPLVREGVAAWDMGPPINKMTLNMHGIAAQCAHLAIWYIGLAVGEAQGSSGRRRKWPLAGPPFENLGRFSYVQATEVRHELF